MDKETKTHSDIDSPHDERDEQVLRGDAPPRKGSVALNIVENPLQVSQHDDSTNIPNVSCSVFRLKKLSPMLELLLRRMICLNTPSFSARLLSSREGRQPLRMSPNSTSRSGMLFNTNTIISGMDPSCFGIQFPSVPLELPLKAGIKREPTAPICPFHKNSG